MRNILISAIVLEACVILCGQTTTELPSFVDIGESAGLSVSNISTAEKKYMIESMSGGVGFIDCDNDGKLDIITVNGSSVDRYKAGGDLLITLYHQEPGLKFKDITLEAGLNRKGWGMGVAVADFDNDGWQDIYVTGYGGSVLYRNKGNCKFEDVTAQAGVAIDGFPTGAAWGDYDRDGSVDLFVARYTHLNVMQYAATDPWCNFLGVKVFCGPWAFPGESDLLFHNKGNGQFEDVSKKAGVANDEHRHGMQAVWADFENNGWPDLYVANDRGGNYFYHNNRDGTFEETGILSGNAFNGAAKEMGSMGVGAADYMHDGNLSIFVTNFQQESDVFFRNLGHQEFEDVSTASGVTRVTFPYVGWGVGFVDFTNSGWDDLLVADGHIYPQIDEGHFELFSYREPLLLLQSNRDGTFRNVTHPASLDKLPLKSRRGMAFGDINNDGKPDVLILNIGEPPTLLLNCSRNDSHAVLIKLTGTKSNRAAIGARVTVTAGNLKQTSEVRSGESYLSQNDLRLHFGLGIHTNIDSLDIDWPSGTRQSLHGIAADSIYTIEEGAGVRKTEPFTAFPEACRERRSSADPGPQKK